MSDIRYFFILIHQIIFENNICRYPEGKDAGVRKIFCNFADKINMTTITPIYLASKRALRPLLACAAIITLLLCGCGQSATRRTLLHAESIMEDHADSAYTILSALRMDSTAPEEDRALHALLLTQAMLKTHRLGTSPQDVIDSHRRMIDNAIG